ncbi:MAG: hypothetical protein AAGJ81_12160 [Verrucomicrobiota bacterium]
MDKNRIEGRRTAVSWHNTAKPNGSRAEVNAAVVQGSIVPLPGEVSFCGTGGFQPAHKAGAPVAAMPLAVQKEKSAEGIVVFTEPVSSRHRETER